MSAYALTGNLFLPSTGSSSSSVTRKQSSTSSSKTSSSSPTSGPLHTQIHTNVKSSEQGQQRKTNGFGISIKDARIDPIRLLASNTSLKKRSSSFLSKSSSSSMEKKSKDSFDAIKFELSISFSGRTYTATRTLPRIMQLRNELINEMNARRNSWNSRHRSRHQRYLNEQETCTDQENDEISDEGISVGINGDDSGEIKIPELPECVQENAENGRIAGE